MSQPEETIVIKQKNKFNSATVILFHGSMSNAHLFKLKLEAVIGDFSLPHIKFVIPTAPLQKFTALNKVTNIWFDRDSIAYDCPENLESLDAIKSTIVALVQKEVETGIPLNRIVVGGYSMGGCLTFHTVYRFISGLAGAFTLSAFLNQNSILNQEFNGSSTPLLMIHGSDDEIVPYAWGLATHANLCKLGVKAEFITLSDINHFLRKDELEKVMEFIKAILPE